jgi:hypothetical protein
MKHLVIGCGEVGKALMEVLGCEGHDPQKGYDRMDAGPVDMLHICIPYSESRPPDLSENVTWLPFKDWVQEYQLWFKPTYTIIHSTVPIGTSDSLGAHHSPIRGRHPHLAASIRTFQKYVGGLRASDVCAEFENHGMLAVAVKSARDTEAGKLIDLMQFGQSVLLEKSIHEFCEQYKLSFDLVYTHFNQSYNAGYSQLGEQQFRRPVLKHVDGPIGGHCVVQNMKWLKMHEAEEIRCLNSVLSNMKEPV